MTNTPNTFKKYTAGVYCMKSNNAKYAHGDTTTIMTKRGKAIDVTVWKKLLTGKDGFTYYSYVRDDGFNRSAWTQKKLDRAEGAAQRQERLSNAHYEKSNKDRDFLSLGEPIKVGHHSERKHRKIIENANTQMRKSVESHDKAAHYHAKSSTLEARLKKEINLDNPESVELLQQRISDLELQRNELKASGDYAPFELKNLGANIRRYKKRYETALILWDRC